MEARLVKSVEAVVAPIMLTDEHVEHVSCGGVMPPSNAHVAGNIAAGAAAAAAAAATGFGLATVTMAQRYYFVLTDQRLLFVEQDMRRAKPTESVPFTMRRSDLCAERARSFPSGKVLLNDSRGAEVCTLFFPLAVRADGSRLLKLLA